MRQARDTAAMDHKGIAFQVSTHHDDDHGPPWEDDDGRGIVTDWLYYPDDPNLRKLGREQRDGTARYFDIAATRAKAAADGWGLNDEERAQLPPDATADQILDAVVEGEFRFLDGWCSDDWEYIGVVVTEPITGASAALWGIESCAGAYLQEVAREQADAVIAELADGGGIAERIAALQQLQAAVEATP